MIVTLARWPMKDLTFCYAKNSLISELDFADYVKLNFPCEYSFEVVDLVIIVLGNN